VVHLLDPAIKQIGLINTYEYGGCISNAWGVYPYPVSTTLTAGRKGLMVAWNLHSRYILYIRNRPSSSPTRTPISRQARNINRNPSKSRTRLEGPQYPTARGRCRVRCPSNQWIGTFRRGNNESKSSGIYNHGPDTFGG